MNYKLVKDVISLVEEFEISQDNKTGLDIEGFKRWVQDGFFEETIPAAEPYWVGKENGRSAESVISTLLVHLNRYAKTYSRSAIFGSEFSTQEDFIYLINLKALGVMSKMELIKKNIHDKPTGMLTINRLISKGWVEQAASQTDKRSRIIAITTKGIEALESQMVKIKQATNIVAGDLSQHEKMELIRLLQKLDEFHQPIYHWNLDSSELLNKANDTLFSTNDQPA